MKSGSILSILSTILLVSANPLLAKRSSSPGGCRPAAHNVFVNNADCGASLKLNIVGNALQVVFPPISGKVYATVSLNIGTSVPTSDNAAAFNFNKFCALVGGGASALCTVPLASISNNLCAAVDLYIGARATFTSGATAWLAGPCYSPSCKSHWSMYSRFRFDCSGTSGGGARTTTSVQTVTFAQAQTVTKTAVATVTARTTRVVTATTTAAGVAAKVTRTVTGTTTKVLTATTTVPGSSTRITRTVVETTTHVVTATTTTAGVAAKVTRTVTGTTTKVLTATTTVPGSSTRITRTVVGTTTKVVTTTATAAGIVTRVTRTVTGTTTQVVTHPTTVTVVSGTTSVRTVTVTSAAQAASTCPSSLTGWVNSGSGISALSTLLEPVTNLITCSPDSLLTGTYGDLNVPSSSGSLLRVGTVFIKQLAGDTLFVRTSADPGYVLSSVGASADCNLLGLGGLDLSSCPLFGLCSVLNGVENTSVSGLLNVGSSGLISGLTCLLGPLEMAIQGVVQRVVAAGESC